MRALTYRQAARCEDATGPRCRCRCGGAAHGANRQAAAAQVVNHKNGDPTDNRPEIKELKEPPQRTPRAFLEALPATDAHHVPAQKGKP